MYRLFFISHFLNIVLFKSTHRNCQIYQTWPMLGHITLNLFLFPFSLQSLAHWLPASASSGKESLLKKKLFARRRIVLCESILKYRYVWYQTSIASVPAVSALVLLGIGSVVMVLHIASIKLLQSTKHVLCYEGCSPSQLRQSAALWWQRTAPS